MFKIIAIPVKNTKTNIIQLDDGSVRFIDQISVDELLKSKFVEVALYAVSENALESPLDQISYIVVDSFGDCYYAVADSLENDKPKIPDWLIRAWLKDNEIRFTVTKEADETLTFQLSYLSRQKMEFQAALKRARVFYEDFKVVRLTKTNDFILRHIKSNKIVLLEKKYHRQFFAGKPYKVIKQKTNKRVEKEILIL
ncbi:MAG: hypothetical protein NZM39_12305, partial [Bernardetiaceae bacterium]|nr:hypothetical protein [Bernardetiaceae bacterium]